MIVNIEKELTTHLADHEFLLSFNDDSDAIEFEVWWIAEGREQFINYLNDREA